MQTDRGGLINLLSHGDTMAAMAATTFRLKPLERFIGFTTYPVTSWQPHGGFAKDMIQGKFKAKAVDITGKTITGPSQAGIRFATALALDGSPSSTGRSGTRKRPQQMLKPLRRKRPTMLDLRVKPPIFQCDMVRNEGGV